MVETLMPGLKKLLESQVISSTALPLLHAFGPRT